MPYDHAGARVVDSPVVDGQRRLIEARMEGIKDANIMGVGGADVLVVNRVRDCLPRLSIAIAEGIG